MIINYDALSRMTGAATGMKNQPPAQEEAAERTSEANESAVTAHAPRPSPIGAQTVTSQTDADGVIADPSLPRDDTDALRFSTSPGDTLAPVATKPRSKLWVWKRDKTPAAKGVAESPAKKVNQARYAIIGAFVFAVGIVVAPWFANQSDQHEPDKPLGPNAAAVVASTLSNSAMGLTLPTHTTDTNRTVITEAAAPPAPQTQVDIPPVGEARYAAMLGAIKETAPTPVVPAISVRHTPDSSRAGQSKEPERVAKRIIPVPLRMETGADTPASEPESEPGRQQNGNASDLYKVVRIDKNRVGEFVAYIAPIGAREATQGSWAFVGDTTNNGFYIEGMTAYHVLFRAPNGRVQQLTP